MGFGRNRCPQRDKSLTSVAAGERSEGATRAGPDRASASPPTSPHRLHPAHTRRRRRNAQLAREWYAFSAPRRARCSARRREGVIVSMRKTERGRGRGERDIDRRETRTGKVRQGAGEKAVTARRLHGPKKGNMQATLSNLSTASSSVNETPEVACAGAGGPTAVRQTGARPARPFPRSES